MARSPEPFDLSRRAFLRGRPLAIDADSWDEVEARAAHFGIVPGTTVGPERAPGAVFGNQPFLGEIMLVAFGFAPKNWAQCNGQLLPINQNQALFSLLGTTFGGNGQTTFALPDLRSRIPMHAGSGPGLSQRSLGERSGVENVTVTAAQLAAHTHGIGASSAGTTPSPVGGYVAPTSGAAFASGATAGLLATWSVGGGQAHSNLPPYLVMNFCIALSGVFPSRN